MYAVYQGVRPGLSPEDVAGIQALYGARTPDAFQSSGQGTNSTDAIDMTGQLNASGQATLTGVSLATIGDTEYFSVTAPADAGSTLQVGADANGTSLLSPRVTIYNASMQPLASTATPPPTATTPTFKSVKYNRVNITSSPSPARPATSSRPARTNFTSPSPPERTLTTQPNNPPSLTSGLTGDQQVVQALYNDFLGRSGSIQELNGWVAALPSIGQEGVATAIIHSQESLDRIVNQLYETNLGRAADPTGMAYWSNLLEHGGTEEQVLTGLLSSAEFVDRSAALNPGADPTASFIAGLDSVVLHRQQSTAEVANVLGLIPSVGISGVAAAYVDSAEFHSDAIQGLYNNLLHRSASSGELSAWVGSGRDLLSIETLIAGTSEFYRNG